MEKIKNIFKKVLTKEVILYIIFGILTTIINLGTFYVMNNIWGWDNNLANFLAILLAVLVAYITNKDMVFHSVANTIKDRVSEFFRFITGRVFTMMLEFFGGVLLFQLPIPEIISKGFITIVVIILNFFISKFYAFKKDEVL